MQKNPQKALQLLELAAKSGLKQVHIIQRTICSDITASLNCIRILLFNFLQQAQTELGVLYTEDERKDLERAAGLFKLAADQKVWSQILCKFTCMYALGLKYG